jgi:hypothetical protein
MKKNMRILGEEVQFLELENLNFWLCKKLKSLVGSPCDSFLLKHHETYIDKAPFYGCITNAMKSMTQNLLDSKKSNSKKHIGLWQACKDKRRITHHYNLHKYAFFLSICVCFLLQLALSYIHHTYPPYLNFYNPTS